MFFILAIKESLALLLALIIGFVNRRKLTKPWKVLLIQTFFNFIIVVVAYAVTMYQRENHLPYNNQWVYNISIVLEGSLLFYAAFEFLKTRINLLNVVLIALPFYLVFALHIYFYSFRVFANYAYVVLGISLAFLFSLKLYFMFTEKEGKLYSSPEVYVSIGIILYFTCLVPYISLFTHLQKYFPYLSIMLFDYIVDGFSNLRYMFLAVGFWLIYKNSHVTSKQS